MMVSTERIRSLSDWFNGVGALAVPGEELACEVKAALDELLSYREGYDPAERMPEAGQQVVVEFASYKGAEPVKDRCLSTFNHARQCWTGEGEWRVWMERANWAMRWYPIGRGEG